MSDEERPTPDPDSNVPRWDSLEEDSEEVAAEMLPAPREEDTSWEAVLARAGDRGSTARVPLQPAAPSKFPPWAGSWLKAAVPVLVILLYVGFRMATTQQVPQSPDLVEHRPLTGVAPPVETAQMDSAARELVSRLEGMMAREDWPGILVTIGALDKELAAHPAVRAFRAIARVETGEGSRELLEEVRVLEPVFAGDSRQRPMRDYLRLMQAELIFRLHGGSAESLRIHTDRLRQLLADLPMTGPHLRIRMKLAERYERFGAEEEKAAGSYFRDRLRLRTARALYQQGLRWVTTREGWLDAQPISPGQPAIQVERFTHRIRQMNKAINGYSLPYTGADRNTWTGRAGTPVHDAPNGTW
jgi:hypothetical protein